MWSSRRDRLSRAVALPALLRTLLCAALTADGVRMSMERNPVPVDLNEQQDPRLETAEELVLGGRAREEAPAIALLNTIVEQALQQSSSDIHIEPGPTNSVVRMRVDGVMY